MADIIQLKEKGVVLYTKTHVIAVDGLNEKLAEVGANYEPKNTLSFNEQLWRGMAFPQGADRHVMPKTLEECRNGYLITWAPFIDGAVVDDIYVYQFMSKLVVSNKLIVFKGHNYNRGDDFIKRLTIATDRKTIVGNDSNKSGANYNFMMREIRSW